MPARTFGRRSLKTGEVTSWNAVLYLASDKMFPVWQEGLVYGQLSLPASSSSLRGEIEVAAGGLWIGVGQDMWAASGWKIAAVALVSGRRKEFLETPETLCPAKKERNI